MTGAKPLLPLNLCLKPAFDDLFMVQFARVAERSGDAVLGRMLFSFEEDCRWHREWSGALVHMLEEDTETNRAAIGGWTARWQPEVAGALEALASLFVSRHG